MNNLNNKRTLPFSEDYWKEEGGHKWVEYLDATETSLEPFNKIMLEYTGITEAEVVLEVGCGGGANSIELAKRVGSGGSVTAVDISAPILSIARARGAGIQNLEFVEGDAAIIKLETGHYDLIFSRFGVMFFSAPVCAFVHLRNSMKPSARMVFLCWRTLEENAWMNVPTRAIFTIIPPAGPPPAPDDPGPFSLASRTRIEEILTAAGFRMIQVKAVDIKMELGTLPDTVEYFMKMGPGAAALAGADEHQKDTVSDVLTKALRQFETAGKVIAPAAAWIVSARF